MIDRISIIVALTPFLKATDRKKEIRFEESENKIYVGEKVFHYYISDEQKVLFIEERKKKNGQIENVICTKQKLDVSKNIKTTAGKIVKNRVFLTVLCTSLMISMAAQGKSVDSPVQTEEETTISNNYEQDQVPSKETVEIDLNEPEEPILSAHQINIPIEPIEKETIVETTTQEETKPSVEETKPSIEETKPELTKMYDVPCSADYQQYIYNLCLEKSVPFRITMTIGYLESNGNWNNHGKISATNDYGMFQINVQNFPYLMGVFGYQNTKEDIERFKNDILYNDRFNAQCAIELMSEWFKNCESVEECLGKYNGWTGWRNKPISIKYVNKGIKIYNEVFFPLEIDETDKKALHI